MSLTTQIEFSRVDLKLLQSLLSQECGVFVDEAHLPLLQDRVRQRLQARRIDGFYDYYRLLTSREGKQELGAILENVSARDSGFFRNKPQLELFQNVILNELLFRKAERREWRLRAWSAGCSTGQEAYTLAIQMCNAVCSYYLSHPGPQEARRTQPLVPPPWRIDILASEVSYASLQTARAGIYLEPQMAEVDYNHRLRYFDKIGDRYGVKSALKEIIQFDMHNLKAEYLPPPSDVIFCRNIMIYLEGEEQKRLIEKFYRCLNPGGYLFVGQAESLFGLTDKFRMIHQNNGTAYQRIDGAV